MDISRVERLLSRVESFRPLSAIAIGAAMIATIGAVDGITGFEVRIAVLYYAPVALLSWRFPSTGFAWAAVAAAGTWVSANMLGPRAPTSVGIWVWNSSATLAAFLFVAALLSGLRQRFDQLRELSVTDALTGLLNRRGFDNALRREHARARELNRPLSLVFMDLDDLKTINDTEGHAAGDSALRLVADTLRRHAGAIEALARLGGDEFAVLLPERGAAATGAFATAVLQDLRRSAGTNGRRLTLSIGAATFDSMPAYVEDATNAADELMYESKRAGKGRVTARLFDGERAT